MGGAAGTPDRPGTVETLAVLEKAMCGCGCVSPLSRAIVPLTVFCDRCVSWPWSLLTPVCEKRREARHRVSTAQHGGATRVELRNSTHSEDRQEFGAKEDEQRGHHADHDTDTAVHARE